MKERVFHNLNKKEQNEIRRKYKQECPKEYRYSIKLYIIYVIIGIIAILGLLCIYFSNVILGTLIFVISFILLIVIAILLNKSNRNFYTFLENNNMSYNKKN